MIDYYSYKSGAVDADPVSDLPAYTRAVHIILPLTNKSISEGKDKVSLIFAETGMLYIRPCAVRVL